MPDQLNDPLHSPSFTYNQALEFIPNQNRRQERQLHGIVKRRSRMRDFRVTSDADGEFVVQARTINAAYNRALKRIGTRHRVIVDGGDRVLTSVPTG